MPEASHAFDRRIISSPVANSGDSHLWGEKAGAAQYAQDLHAGQESSARSDDVCDGRAADLPAETRSSEEARSSRLRARGAAGTPDRNRYGRNGASPKSGPPSADQSMSGLTEQSISKPKSYSALETVSPYPQRPARNERGVTPSSRVAASRTSRIFCTFTASEEAEHHRVLGTLGRARGRVPRVAVSTDLDVVALGEGPENARRLAVHEWRVVHEVGGASAPPVEDVLDARELLDVRGGRTGPREGAPVVLFRVDGNRHDRWLHVDRLRSDSAPLDAPPTDDEKKLPPSASTCVSFLRYVMHDATHNHPRGE